MRTAVVGSGEGEGFLASTEAQKWRKKVIRGRRESEGDDAVEEDEALR